LIVSSSLLVVEEDCKREKLDKIENPKEKEKKDPGGKKGD
jgi:hypothetical protein